MSERRRLMGYTNTGDNSIDLSLVDNAGNTRSKMTTSNCYLVHGSGNYKIPLVYGNAIKNGSVNTLSFIPGGTSGTYYTTNFVNHNGDAITGPWITRKKMGVYSGMGINVHRAALLWQDTPSLIKQVSVKNNYLYFTVGTFSYGNAVIAVMDASGTIVWSWHIWATDNNLTGTTIISTGTHSYTVSPVNVGWVPTGGDGKLGYCTYYQWGRKDAIIPSTGTSATDHTVYDISNNVITGMIYELNNNATIADNIKNPKTFFHNSSTFCPCNTLYFNMWNAQLSSYDNSDIATPTQKTIYDPCPPDFCVPTSNLYSYMKDNSSSYFVWDNTNRGRSWTKDSPNVYFPGSGMRQRTNGTLQNTYGTSYPYGFFWASTQTSGSSGRYFGFYYQGVLYSSYEKSIGMCVRPVLEE